MCDRLGSGESREVGGDGKIKKDRPHLGVPVFFVSAVPIDGGRSRGLTCVSLRLVARVVHRSCPPPPSPPSAVIPGVGYGYHPLVRNSRSIVKSVLGPCRVVGCSCPPLPGLSGPPGLAASG